MYSFPVTSVKTGKSLAPVKIDDMDYDRVLKIVGEMYPNEQEFHIHQPEFTKTQRPVYRRFNR